MQASLQRVAFTCAFYRVIIDTLDLGLETQVGMLAITAGDSAFSPADMFLSLIDIIAEQ